MKVCMIGKDTGLKDVNCSIKLFSISGIMSYYERGILKIPDFQRELQVDKVDSIYQEFIQRYKKGENYFIKHGYTLSVCQLKDKNECYIIDGQHRFRALCKLNEEGFDITFSVRLQVCHTLSEMKRDFKLLNSNSDMPLLYKSFENIFACDMILEFKHHIKTHYACAFNKSKAQSTCNRMHLDSFMELINPSLICSVYETQKADIGHAELLISYVERINKEVYESIHTDIQHYVKGSDQKYVQGCGFYLSLKNVEWVHCLYGSHPPRVKAIYYKKNKIPKSVSRKVIEDHFSDKYISECYVCKTSINRDSAQMGHIVSEYNGGSAAFDNLKCICKSCNSSMGIMNLMEFKKTYFEDGGK